MFIEIPYIHFHTEVADFIKQEHYSLLTPYTQRFFKYGHMYMAIGFQNNSLIIEYVINTGKRKAKDLDYVQAIGKWAKDNGNKSIMFMASINNNIVLALAEKHGAKVIEELPNFFKDGIDYLKYEYVIGE